MVRRSDLRKRKYESNVDPEALKRQFSAVKPIMVEGQSVYFPQIAEVERKVKQICEESGTTSYQVAQYINFGRQLYSLSNKFRGQTLVDEACIKVQTWSSRGLDNTLLTEVLALFGLSCPSLLGISQFNLFGIEKVLLLDEEKTTTWNLTGDTGLLLGTIDLPAPKNHLAITYIVAVSYEQKTDGGNGALDVRFYDAVQPETTLFSGGVDTLVYAFHVLNFFGTSFDAVAYSIRGNTNVELRLYLVGSNLAPNDNVYCRNLVITVIPLYKS